MLSFLVDTAKLIPGTIVPKTVLLHTRSSAGAIPWVSCSLPRGFAGFFSRTAIPRDSIGFLVSYRGGLRGFVSRMIMAQASFGFF